MSETDEALETLLADSDLHDADKAALREYQQYRKFRNECQQKGIKPIPTLANWLKLRNAPAPSALDTARAALKPFADAWRSYLEYINGEHRDTFSYPYTIVEWMESRCDSGLITDNYQAAADALAALEGGGE